MSQRLLLQAEASTPIDSELLRASARPTAEPALADSHAELARALEASQAEQARLERQLNEQLRRATDLEQGSVDARLLIAKLEQQLEVTRTLQQKAESELATLRSAHEQ